MNDKHAATLEKHRLHMLRRARMNSRMSHLYKRPSEKPIRSFDDAEVILTLEIPPRWYPAMALLAGAEAH